MSSEHGSNAMWAFIHIALWLILLFLAGIPTNDDDEDDTDAFY